MKAATENTFHSCTILCISIHAAREGGDWDDEKNQWVSKISIHAAREGGDELNSKSFTAKIFQSTPPVKAATAVAQQGHRFKVISIHAAREGGDRKVGVINLWHFISIHAAREGGDGGILPVRAAGKKFQSTPPVKAATLRCSPPQCLKRFQSTPPVKAATVLPFAKSTYATISIHAAREGGDFTSTQAQQTSPQFQSTPPVKAATAAEKSFLAMMAISIHAAREGGDICPRWMITRWHDFNPRRP